MGTGERETYINPGKTSLVVRSEQMGLDVDANKQFLVGFTPHLPARLMRLNKVLSSRPRSAKIQRVHLQFRATRGLPIINTEVEYRGGADVFLNSYPLSGRAELGIIDSNRSGAVSFALDQLQSFFAANFSGEDITLNISPNSNVRNPPDEVSEDLDLVTVDLLKPFLEGQPCKDKPSVWELSYDECWVSIPTQEEPIAKIKLIEDLKALYLSVYEFYYTGTPEEVERIVDVLSSALSEENKKD